MIKVIAIFIALVLAAMGAFVLLKPRSDDDTRKAFARHVVDSLVAGNWDRMAMKPFLCEDGLFKDRLEKSGITFDSYRNYRGIKGVGKIKVLPVTPPPAMAMDTFVPIVFDQRFVPYPSMPDHIAFHAAYIQLQTQEISRGKWCLQGWGRNDLPVNTDQAEDFLNYRGIFVQS